MPDRWETMSLRDAGVALIDCDHRTPPAAAAGYPYIAIPQLKEGRIELSDVRRISQEHYVDWTRKAVPQAHDVVLSRRCNPGETAYVPEGLKCALGQNLVLLRSDGKKVFPPFLRWLVRSPAWWEQIQKFLNVGAIFDSLKCADVPNFTLPVPPIDNQKVISAVLSSLDDKIELNRRMNETLEAMARATFKSWFVDFDPVQAKSEGRKPAGMDEATAALFPNAFQPSPLGPIPKGWEVHPFTDIVDVIGGGTPKTSVAEYWNGTIPWFSVVDAPTEHDVFVIETEKHVTDSGVQESSTRVLPEGTTIISARGTVGKVALCGVPMAMNQSCYGLHGKEPVSDSFTYFVTRTLVQELLQRTHGSVFDTITRDTLGSVSVAMPSVELFPRFEAAVAPFLGLIKSNLRESRTLAQCRDTLLPKLLSGELAIGSNV